MSEFFGVGLIHDDGLPPTIKTRHDLILGTTGKIFRILAISPAPECIKYIRKVHGNLSLLLLQETSETSNKSSTQSRISIIREIPSEEFHLFEK